MPADPPVHALMSFEPLPFGSTSSLGPAGEPSTRFGGSSSRKQLGWRIKPTEDTTPTKLTTGETLGDFEGHVGVTIGTATPEGEERYAEGTRRGTMHWFNEYSNEGDNAYLIQLHVDPALFELLETKAFAGHLPTVFVHVAGDGLQAESFGLNHVWDNKTHNGLEIGWFTFHYALSPNQIEEGDEEAIADQAARSPLTVAEFGKGVTKLEVAGKRIAIAIWVLVAIVVLARWLS